MPPLRVRQAQNDPLSQNRHRRDLVGAETNAFGIRQPSLGGRGTALAVDEGNLYNQAKRDNLQTLRIMKSCLRHDEIIKLTFYNEIFRSAENEIKSVLSAAADFITQ